VQILRQHTFWHAWWDQQSKIKMPDISDILDVAIEDLSRAAATAEGRNRSVSAEMLNVIQKEQKWRFVPQERNAQGFTVRRI
jgi:predicted glycosyl hydrolase (DUF1957 family)